MFYQLFFFFFFFYFWITVIICKLQQMKALNYWTMLTVTSTGLELRYFILPTYQKRYLRITLWLSLRHAEDADDWFSGNLLHLWSFTASEHRVGVRSLNIHTVNGLCNHKIKQITWNTSKVGVYDNVLTVKVSLWVDVRACLSNALLHRREDLKSCCCMENIWR